jgi:hypothetical protein
VRSHSGWGGRVDSQFACLLGCNNAARIQQIVRLFCLSRPLQAPPKTSADLRSEVSSSANQPHLLGLNSPVGATGRAVSGNARAPSSLKADIPLCEASHIYLCRSSVCPSFSRAGTPRRRILLLAAVGNLQATCIRPSVLLLLSTALNLSGSIARQYRLYAVYTLAKHIHMFNVTVKLIALDARTKVYQSDMSGSKFIAVLL